MVETMLPWVSAVDSLPGGDCPQPTCLHQTMFPPKRKARSIQTIEPAAPSESQKKMAPLERETGVGLGRTAGFGVESWRGDGLGPEGERAEKV